MSAYSDYCAAEKAEGRKPLSPSDWKAAREAANPDHANLTPPTPVPDEVREALEPALAAEREALHGTPQPAPGDRENDPEDAAPRMIDTLDAKQSIPAAEAVVPLEADNIVDPEKAREMVEFYRQRLAEAEVAASMVPQADLRAKAEADAEAAGKWVFHNQNRLGAIVLRSIPPYSINGHFVPGEHKTADFSHYRWMTEDAELARLLMETEAYKKGEVMLVPEGAMQPPAHVRVVDGPRTSVSIQQRTHEADRPRGPLSTTVR